jgi:hypothetical protein
MRFLFSLSTVQYIPNITTLKKNLYGTAYTKTTACVNLSTATVKVTFRHFSSYAQFFQIEKLFWVMYICS